MWRPMAWPLRCAAGIVNDGILAPFVWTSEKAGCGDLVFRAMRRFRTGSPGFGWFGMFSASARSSKTLWSPIAIAF